MNAPVLATNCCSARMPCTVDSWAQPVDFNSTNSLRGVFGVTWAAVGTAASMACFSSALMGFCASTVGRTSRKTMGSQKVAAVMERRGVICAFGSMFFCSLILAIGLASQFLTAHLVRLVADFGLAPDCRAHQCLDAGVSWELQAVLSLGQLFRIHNPHIWFPSTFQASLMTSRRIRTVTKTWG